MAGGIGSPVSDNVAKQIEARKKVIGKTTNKTVDDLLYTTSRTGWVRLSSSVNTITDEEAKRLEDGIDRTTIKGNNQLAGYNILQGGLLNPNRTLRKGMNVYDEVSDTDIADKAAYQNRAGSTGIRPMPGITSMTVKSKNTFGTLREAEVQFSVWTLEDFENIERIYLRPGFTMLLEWGHSIYVDNDGKLITDIQAVQNYFFKNGVRSETILRDIVNKRVESNYNYEGMLGYAKNFSWSFNVNGGYDCTLSIISTGEILESLKITFDPGQRVNQKELDSAGTVEGKYQRKSIYHFFIKAVQEFTDSPTFTKSTLAGKAPSLAKLLEDFTGYYQYVFLDTGFFQGSDTPMHWITLRTFFDIFNKYIVTVDTTKQEEDPDRRYVMVNTDYASSSKYLTCQEHFSIDPTVCVLMNKASVYETNWINSIQQLKVDSIHDNLVIPKGSTYDDVLNILVSLPYIKAVLDSMIDVNGKSDKSAYDLFRAVLDGVETAMGGINDFDFTFDDDLNRFFLVDRNNTPLTTQKTPEFKLTGLDSIFTEVSISSKITNNVGSQISVAAQGSTLNYSDNVKNILKWNPNVIDRVRPVKDTTTAPINSDPEAEEERKERVQEWLDDVAEFYDSFNSSTGYDKEDLDAAKTMHAEWTVEMLDREKTKKNEQVPGLVPVELSFKLDGIGGFKIGESFRISPGILPSKYQGKFGYIVTGMEHSLDAKNRWETSITAQFYFIGQQATIV